MIDFQHKNCEDALKEIPDGSIDCVLTDPPYLYLKNQKLDRPFDEKLVFSELYRVLKKNGFIVMFGRGTSFYRWNTMLADMGMVFKEEIIWDRRRPSSPVNPLARRHETVTVSGKGSGGINRVKLPFIDAYRFDPHKIEEMIYRLTTTFGNRKTFELVREYYATGQHHYTEASEGRWYVTYANDIPKLNRTLQFACKMEEGVLEGSIISESKKTNTKSRGIHPTEKPVRLLERLMALVTKEGDTVLDPFAGSGSTAIACINQNRNFIGFEIDEEFYNGAKHRIDEHLGQMPLLKEAA